MCARPLATRTTLWISADISRGKLASAIMIGAQRS
jgi:hypothetical protein